MEQKKIISATIGDIPDLTKVIKIKIFDQLKLDFIKFGLFVENSDQMLKFLSNIKSCDFKTELVPVIFVDDANILKIAFKNLESFKKFKFNFLLLDTFSKKMVICLKLFIKLSFKIYRKIETIRTFNWPSWKIKQKSSTKVIKIKTKNNWF